MIEEKRTCERCGADSMKYPWLWFLDGDNGCTICRKEDEEFTPEQKNG